MSWHPFDEDEGDAEREDAAPDGVEPFVPGARADEDEPELSGRWPLDPRGLLPRERWQWYEQLWSDACMLRARYRLGLGFSSSLWRPPAERSFQVLAGETSPGRWLLASHHEFASGKKTPQTPERLLRRRHAPSTAA